MVNRRKSSIDAGCTLIALFLRSLTSLADGTAILLAANSLNREARLTSLRRIIGGILVEGVVSLVVGGALLLLAAGGEAWVIRSVEVVAGGAAEDEVAAGEAVTAD